MKQVARLTTILLIIAVCITQNGVAQDMRSVCFEGIPEGTYALSVCDVVAPTEKTDIFNELPPYSPSEIDSIRKAYPRQYFGYETEQVISGYVKGTLGKVRKPQLHVFIPKTGYRETYDMEGQQRFRLSGLDFVDGTDYVLQVTRPSGSHGLIQLYVDDVLFPMVSVKRFDKDESCDIFSDNKETQEYARKIEQHTKTIELPEIEVKGRRITSMRFGNISPEKGYGAGDPMLTKGYTMEYLISKLGFLISLIGENKVPYLWRPLRDGWGSRLEKITPVVYIDDFPLESNEIEELWNIQSEMVKQIEYYPPEESDGNMVLRGNEAGALYIYTNTRPDYGKTLSMVTVHQIGYQPERTFQPSCYHGPTVLWNPSLKVGEDGKANISFDAVKGKQYRVILEGISDNGVTVRKEATL